MFGSLVAMLDQSLIMHVGRGQVRSQVSSGSAGWWSVEVKTRRNPKRICIALTKRTCQSSTFASVDTGSLKALAVSYLVLVVMTACTRTVRTLSHE